jgi:hypothetical protein
MMNLGIGLARNVTRSRYDGDALAFFQRGSVTDLTQRNRHNQMVLWLKAEGLWNSVWIWYGADGGALSSISPDVAATPGQGIRRLINRKGNYCALDQATANAQPILTNLGPNGILSISPDGVNDSFTFTANQTISQPFTLVMFGKDMGLTGVADRNIIRSSNKAALYIRGALNPGNNYFIYAGSVWETTHSAAGSSLTALTANGTSSESRQSGKTKTIGDAGTSVGLAFSADGMTMFVGNVTAFAGGNWTHLMVLTSTITDAQFSSLLGKLNSLYGTSL